MEQTVIAVIDWAEDPLPAEAHVLMHRRSEVAEALRDRPELGACLPVLKLKYGGRWAVTSASEPGKWHSVVLAEHGSMIGARCSCQAGQFAGRRTVGCSHAAAVLRQVLEVEAEHHAVGMTA